MQPSELLVAAADRIRDLAAAATPGPWEIEYDYSGSRPQALWRMDPEHPGDVDASLSLGALAEPADNVWVAALSPAVAPHLEAWLRHSADSWAYAESRAKAFRGSRPEDFVADVEKAALALAKSIISGVGVGSQ